MKLLLQLGACALLVLLLVRQGALERQLALSSAREPTGPESTPRMVISPLLADQVAERVVRLLDARKQAAPSMAAQAVPAGSPTATERAPDQAQRKRWDEALEQANAVLDQAIDSGKLTRDDVLEMSEYLSTIPDPAAGDALRRRIAKTLNTTNLAIEDRGFVFP